jgi:hypothetical protein
MSSAITETDTYTATITAPDAGDAITAASVRTMGQGLTNRSLHHENRIDDLETAMAAVETVADTAAADALAVYTASVKPAGATYAASAYITFSGLASYASSGTFTLTSSDQWMQLPRAGAWRVDVHINSVITAGTTVNEFGWLDMLVATNATPTTSPYTFGAAVGYRGSDDASQSFTISGHSFITVSDLALSRIALRVNAASDDLQIAAGGSDTLNLRRISFTWLGDI